MNRKFKKSTYAIIAGANAAALLLSASAKASVIVTGVYQYSESVNGTTPTNGASYDVIDFFVTGLNGTADTSSSAGHPEGVILLDGAFTATGGGSLAVPGDNSVTTPTVGNWTNFITPSGETNLTVINGTPSNPAYQYDSSYVNFANTVGAITRSGTGTSNVSSSTNSHTHQTTYSLNGVTGTSSSFGDLTGTGQSGNWYANSGTSINAGDTSGSQGNLLAQVLVTTGGGVSFTGTVSTEGSNGEPLTFSYSPSSVTTGGGNTTGSNKIISLTSTAPIGPQPNGYGTLPVGALVSLNGGFAGPIHPAGANQTSGYVTLAGTNGGYVLLALNLSGGAVTPGSSNAATIVAEINASLNSTAGQAIEIPQSGSPFSQYAAAGYDVAIPTATASDFAYDFSNTSSDFTDTDTALGAVTVTAIAAVPEPASAAGLILGASGLLLGRRKSKVTA